MAIAKPLDRGRQTVLSLATAALAVVLALSGQWLTVGYEYGGHWSGLFQRGERWRAPMELDFESVADPASREGYDGQFYHYAAHDPWLKRGFAEHVDDPRLRWRRILLPALAYVLAGGRDEWIDVAYFAAVLAFLFAGTVGASLLCARHRLPASLGLLFVLVPGVITSLEAMTVDIAMATLAVWFALVAAAPRGAVWYVMLALAPLARETGYLLVAGAMTASAQRRDLAAALRSAAAAIPGLLWTGYVTTSTPAGGTIEMGLPFAGILFATRTALELPADSAAALFTVLVHGLAVSGLWLATACGAVLVWRRRHCLGPLEAAIGLFAALALIVADQRMWADAYAYGRVFSPLLILLAAAAVEARSPWMAAPLAMVSLRTAVQAATHLPPILHGIGSP